MKTRKRKLSYWSIEFKKEDLSFFEADRFIRFIAYLEQLDTYNTLHKETKQSKAIALESIKYEVKQNMRLCKLVIKTCKYNHSPNYMSSEDGSERPSEKKLFEGEKELTHICMNIKDDEAYSVFEENRSGINMTGAVNYLNILFRKFIKDDDQEFKGCLWANIIPSEGFLDSLKKTERVSVAELHIDCKLLGSEYFNLLDVNEHVQKDVVLSIKAVRNESLPKAALKGLFKKMTTSESQVERVRLRGKDMNKMSVIIDSLDGRKQDEITIPLRDNGEIDTFSFFSKVEEVLGIYE